MLAKTNLQKLEALLEKHQRGFDSYAFPLRVLLARDAEREKIIDPSLPEFGRKPNYLRPEDNAIYDSNWKEFLGCSEWLRCDESSLNLIVDALNLLHVLREGGGHE